MKLEQEFTKIEKINQKLLDRFLEPYPEHEKYLKQAQFQYPAFQNGRGWSIEAELKIPNFFYMVDKGHLNAIEFNICYNQLYYLAIAYLIENNLLECLPNWNLDAYEYLQHSNFKFVKFSSFFKKLVSSKKFYGTLKIERCVPRRNLIVMQTSCAFYDSNQGWAEGKATVAILNDKSKFLKKVKSSKKLSKALLN